MRATVLVVGGASALARELTVALRARGHRVVVTNRCGEDGALALDLARAPDAWPDLPTGIDVAFLAAAVTDQGLCERDPDGAWRVNVTHTLALARRLRHAGARVVFPSTNLVLACASPWQAAGDERRPIGRYAGMKAAVEAELEADPGVSVCRLAKVLHRGLPLVAGWVGALQGGERVTALSDLLTAPVSSHYVADVLVRVIETDSGGIWQVSGAKEVSYCAVARGLAGRIGVPAERVLCRTSEEAGLDLASRPRHPSLDAGRVERELGLPPQPLEALLDHLVKMHS